MNSRPLMFALVSALLLVSAACETGSLLAPTSVGTVDQFVEAFDNKGLRVTVGDELPIASNPFFSVPGRVVFVNGAHLNAFEYPSADAAAADAAQVSTAGQFRFVLITWISTPRFYRQDRLIALYAAAPATSFADWMR
jgi:hypothetical protein